ncbi:hypothetical protein OIV83_005940 [Microbotryomycetes sp. JL201]|nr:hypothetical protein OIV83_005940 [Microbotryomycetes sp. JL201]
MAHADATAAATANSNNQTLPTVETLHEFASESYASSTVTMPVLTLDNTTTITTSAAVADGRDSTRGAPRTNAADDGKIEKILSVGSSSAEDDKPKNEQGTDNDGEQAGDKQYLTGTKLALVFVSMLSAVWLIALDQTILAPALGIISSQFNALSQLAWIASAYFLTQCAFLLFYGQILTLFDRKWTYLVAITLFEVGSVICAAAPNVNILIFGRAFAGVGAAGIFVAVLAIIADVTKLEDRPKLLGLFGAVFAVSSVVGPLLGGVFCDHVSWRFCFWINPMFYPPTMLGAIFFLGPQPAPEMQKEVIEYTERKIRRWTLNRLTLRPGSFLFKVFALDWIGLVIMLATITCLLLPLQWGGNEYAWSDGPVVGTFAAFAVLVVLIVIWEWKFTGPTSILPLRLFNDRTQIGASLEAFFLMFVMLVGTYFLPLFYEAVHEVSATNAGLQILPFMLGIVFSSGIGGGIVSYWGYYWPLLVCAPSLMCVGGGLLYTVKADTSLVKLGVFQAVLAVGLGFVMQNTLIAVQADCKSEKDIPQKTGLVTFSQLVGGTIGIAIGNTIFGNKLGSALRVYAPDAPYQLVRQSVESIKTLSPELKPGVIRAYVEALNNVFIIAIAAGAAAILSALPIRNLSVKGKQMAPGGA